MPRREPFGDPIRDRLRRIPLFVGLDDEGLDRLAGLSRIVHLPRKHSVFSEGQEHGGMFVVLDGLVVAYTISDEGRMLILDVCRPGDTLADVPLFDERATTYATHARTTRDSELLFLAREPFLAFLRQHPVVAWEMLRRFAASMGEMGRRLEGVTLRDVRSRLARYLLHELETRGLDGEPSPTLELGLTKGSIASYLGTVNETLSRTFNRLVRDRVLAVDGPRITVLDVERLRSLV